MDLEPDANKGRQLISLSQSFQLDQKLQDRSLVPLSKVMKRAWDVRICLQPADFQTLKALALLISKLGDE